MKIPIETNELAKKGDLMKKGDFFTIAECDSSWAKKWELQEVGFSELAYERIKNIIFSGEKVNILCLRAIRDTLKSVNEHFSKGAPVINANDWIETNLNS